MSRLITCGFEQSFPTFELVGSSVVGTAPTVATEHQHIGGRTLTFPKAVASEFRNDTAWTGAHEREYWCRFYCYIDKAFNNDRGIMQWVAVSGLPFGLNVNAAGEMWFFSAGSNVKPGGKLATIWTYGVLHQVEVMINTKAAGNGAVKVFLDGEEVYSSASFETGNSPVAGYRLGWVTEKDPEASLWYDDLAINDNQGASQNGRPGAGHVIFLKPAADKARTGWVAGGSPTTEKLFESLATVPPIGKKSAESEHKTQIKDAENNATDTYEATLQTYTVGGVGESDTVTLIRPFAAFGNNSVTSRELGVMGVSNPEATEVKGGSGTTAAAAHPTGWKMLFGTTVYAPAVTKGTGPVVKVRKATASTDAMSVEQVGFLVEYTPSVGKTVTIAAAQEIVTTIADKIVRTTFVKAAQEMATTFTAKLARTSFIKAAQSIALTATIQIGRFHMIKAAQSIVTTQTAKLQRTAVVQAAQTMSMTATISAARTAVVQAALTMVTTFGAKIARTAIFKAAQSMVVTPTVTIAKTVAMRAAQTMAVTPAAKFAVSHSLAVAMSIAPDITANLVRTAKFKAALEMTNQVKVVLQHEYKPGIYIRTGSGPDDWKLLSS